jgi:heme-binding protein
MKEYDVPLRRVGAIALILLVIGSVVRSRPSLTDVSADPSSALIEPAPPAPPHVMSMLRQACFDCHSDETRWPWYSLVPIASQLIDRDVKDGRAQLNWSRWPEYNAFDRADMLDKVCQLATTHTMPPLRYRMLHSNARLSATDLIDLCDWTRLEADRLVQERR